MRRLLKELLIILLSLFSHDDETKVIFYHDIGINYTKMGTPEDLFKKHIDIISARDKAHRPIVCFDDGFRGLWDYRELLPRLKTRIIVFLAVRLIGMPGYLTWNEIEVLQNRFGIEFQSHTWSHQTLAGPMISESPRGDRTDAWFYHELFQSREELSSRLGREVDALCFPVGYFSQKVLAWAEKAGYRCCYASFPGNMRPNNSSAVMLIPRCLVQDVSPICLRAILGGGMNMLASRYRRLHFWGVTE